MAGLTAPRRERERAALSTPTQIARVDVQDAQAPLFLRRLYRQVSKSLSGISHRAGALPACRAMCDMPGPPYGSPKKMMIKERFGGRHLHKPCSCLPGKLIDSEISPRNRRRFFPYAIARRILDAPTRRRWRRRESHIYHRPRLTTPIRNGSIAGVHTCPGAPMKMCTYEDVQECIPDVIHICYDAHLLKRICEGVSSRR